MIYFDDADRKDDYNFKKASLFSFSGFLLASLN